MTSGLTDADSTDQDVEMEPLPVTKHVMIAEDGGDMLLQLNQTQYHVSSEVLCSASQEFQRMLEPSYSQIKEGARLREAWALAGSTDTDPPGFVFHLDGDFPEAIEIMLNFIHNDTAPSEIETFRLLLALATCCERYCLYAEFARVQERWLEPWELRVQTTRLYSLADWFFVTWVFGNEGAFGRASLIVIMLSTDYDLHHSVCDYVPDMVTGTHMLLVSISHTRMLV